MKKPGRWANMRPKHKPGEGLPKPGEVPVVMPGFVAKKTRSRHRLP